MEIKDIEISVSEKEALDIMEHDSALSSVLTDDDFIDDCADIAGITMGLMKRDNPLDIDVDSDLAKIHGRLDMHRATVRRFWPWIAAAVAVIMVIFYVATKPLFINKVDVMQHYVQVFQACETDTAVMIREFGQEESVPLAMACKNAPLVYDASNHEAKYSSDNDRNAKYSSKRHSLSVPRGKSFKVVLSDNTVVYVNADSRIVYPMAFGNKERVVELEGEALFKVAKDPTRPFIVKSRGVDVLALGTEFNVRNYPSEPLKVTLVSGSVEVSNANNCNKKRLSPGQQASVDKTMNVENVDAEGTVFWKDGLFYFDGVTLKEMMAEIGRWYNTDIYIENDNVAKLQLHFYADRKQDIHHFIKILNRTERIHAVYNNGKIMIK